MKPVIVDLWRVEPDDWPVIVPTKTPFYSVDEAVEEARELQAAEDDPPAYAVMTKAGRLLVTIDVYGNVKKLGQILR